MKSLTIYIINGAYEMYAFECDKYSLEWYEMQQKATIASHEKNKKQNKQIEIWCQILIS